MNKKLASAVFLITALLVSNMIFGAHAVYALTPATTPSPPFRIYSADGSKVFIYGLVDNVTPIGHIPKPFSDVPTRYAGVFHNTNLLEPLYFLSLPMHRITERNVHFSSDLQYLAFTRSFIFGPAVTNDVLVFYHNGDITMRYSGADLHRTNAEPGRFSIYIRFGGPEVGASLNNADNTLTIRSNSAFVYVFDITSGAILEYYRCRAYPLIVIFAGIGVVIAVVKAIVASVKYSYYLDKNPHKR